MYSTCKFKYSCCSDVVNCHLPVSIFPLTSFTLLLPDIPDCFVFSTIFFWWCRDLEQEKSCLS